MWLAHVCRTAFSLFSTKLQLDNYIAIQTRGPSFGTLVTAEDWFKIEKGVSAGVITLQPPTADIGAEYQDAGVVVVEGGVARRVLEKMEDARGKGAREWRSADERSVDTASKGGL